MNKKPIFLQWLTETKNYEVDIFSHLVDEDGVTYVVLESGDRCNIDLINDIGENIKGNVMAFIDGPNNLWQISQKEVGGQKEMKALDANNVMQIVQPYIPGKIVTTIMPPKTHSNTSYKNIILSKSLNPTPDPVVNSFENEKNIIIKEEKIEDSLDNNPVHILIQTSKKVESIINLELEMSIPTQEIYNIIKNNFKNGEDDFLNYLITNLDITSIKESLKDGLRSFYRSNNNL